MMSKLTPKQRKFAKYHYEGLTGRQAYLKAGYSSEGSTADVNACNLLKNPKVQEYIKELEAEGMEEFKISKKELHDKYMYIYDSHKDITPAPAKGALDSVAKMYGLNEPERVDLTTDGESINISIEKTYIAKD